MKGFSVPCSCDRNGKVGGLLLYIREDMQSRLSSKSKCNIETLSAVVNLRKKKWFLNCSCSPHQNLIPNHLECLNPLIDQHSNSFDNFIFIGDFNISTNHNSMRNFCDLNGLKNLMNVPVCYKNSDSSTSIDLILMKRPVTLSTGQFETDLSDFHLPTITEFKTSFQKREPKIIKYHDYKNFYNNKFRSEILKCNFNYTDLRTFNETVFEIFNKFAP